MAVNHALDATFSASHEYNETDYPRASLKNGLKHTNNQWGSGGGWIGGAQPGAESPMWIEIDFGEVKTIHELAMIGLKDDASPNYNTDPTEADTNTAGTLPKDYKWQSWDGAAWVDEVTVTANDKVYKRSTGLSLSTSKVRFIATATWGAWMALVELEAIENVDSSPTITTTTLPDGTVGVAYDQTVSRTSGEQDFTWSVVSGALPDGLSLSPAANGLTCDIQGTPTEKGTFNFTLRVTDTDGDSDDQALSIVVNGFAAFSFSGLNEDDKLEASDPLGIVDESIGAEEYEWRITNSEFTDEFFSAEAEPDPNAWLRSGENEIKLIATKDGDTDEVTEIVEVITKEILIDEFVPVGGRIEFEFSVTSSGVRIIGRSRALINEVPSEPSNEGDATSSDPPDELFWEEGNQIFWEAENEANEILF